MISEQNRGKKRIIKTRFPSGIRSILWYNSLQKSQDNFSCVKCNLVYYAYSPLKRKLNLGYRYVFPRFYKVYHRFSCHVPYKNNNKK